MLFLWGFLGLCLLGYPCILRRWKLKRANTTLILIIAHPDDESMFFVPTISCFDPDEVHVICLSTGNADGLGSVREFELEIACSKVFGIPKANIDIINHPDLLDGMQERWPISTVSEVVFESMSRIPKHHPFTVVTFDQNGVSGHSNHIATSYGVIRMFQENEVELQHASLLLLNSLSLHRKYSGILEAIYLSFAYDENRLVFGNNEISLSYRAMKAHSSQFVWYRKLFVLFSAYSFVNSYTRFN